MANANRSVLAFNLSYQFDQVEHLGRAFARLTRWLEEGAIRPPPLQTFLFADAADAHRELESGRTVGKLVLVV